jgi:hypothetical protein
MERPAERPGRIWGKPKKSWEMKARAKSAVKLWLARIFPRLIALG